MADTRPRKIPLIFDRQPSGNDPVREWLKRLPEAERHAIGKDLQTRATPADDLTLARERQRELER